MKSLIVTIGTWFIFISHVSGQTITPPERGDIEMVYASPIEFITTATLDTPMGRRLRSEGTTTSPFFFVYEGEQTMFNVGVETQAQRKVYKLDSTKKKLELVISEPLVAANDSLTTCNIGNSLVVTERAYKESDTWPLNVVVKEAPQRQFTFLEAQKLLQDRYGWFIPEGYALPFFCNSCSDKLVHVDNSDVVTVRDLVVAMLEVATSEAYKISPADNWIMIYVINNGPQKRVDLPRTFVINQIVHR